jgi:hypothetical protein
MAILDVSKIHIQKFWDDEYKSLNYTREPFNDPESVSKWVCNGFSGPFTGYMCDMRDPQPIWNNRFVEFFEAKGWQDVGTSYYRMDTGTVLPNHSDLYKKYVELFNLKDNEHWIYRAIVFLEDWQSGHYAELDGEPFVGWRAGDCLIWRYDTPHMAANLGDLPRYTLQITGHK